MDFVKDIEETLSAPLSGDVDIATAALWLGIVAVAGLVAFDLVKIISEA